MSNPLLVACRPRQWPKNLLVFAAPLFAFRFEDDIWLRAGASLVAFCLISSAIYLLNDCLDVEADRAHPSKLNRPGGTGPGGVVLLYGLIQLATACSSQADAAPSAKKVDASPNDHSNQGA